MSYNKEETESICKWIGGSLFVGAFGFLTSWLMFNFAWLNRKKGADSIFWWWIDDERFDSNGEFAPDYAAYVVRFGGDAYDALDESWWIAWNWHTRNSVWNLKRSKYLVESTPSPYPGNNNIEVLSIPTDELFRLLSDGSMVRVQQDGAWVASPGLKYIPRYTWEDEWQVNKGTVLSYKTSILGEGLMWFRPTGKTQLHFRYGHCKIVEYKILGLKIWRGWRTVKLGYGNKSYVMTMKHQKITRWE